MKNPVPSSESGGDRLTDATRRIRCLAVVLSRLFEALSNPREQDGPLAGMDRRDDAEFWAALCQVMDDIIGAAKVVQANDDALRSRAASEPPAAANGDSVSGGKTLSASDMAADLARHACEVDVGQITENNQEGWDALVDAVRREKFPHDGHALCSEEHLELYSKVITTLPAELRPEFRRLTMSRTVEEIIERHAAFELGRQIERRDRDTRR